jgi:acetyltransferase-like isoleucine patch superfamily enzyme
MLIAWLKTCYPGLLIGHDVVVGKGTRIRVLNGATLEIGARTVIEPHCLIVSEGTLTIGPDGFIGTGSTIVACGTIAIGSDALIAGNVTIRDQDHRTAAPDTPYRLQGFVMRPVTIGSNVWLGTNAVVLKGVTIGDGAVVAAAAVVSRDVAGRSIVAGIPARLLRTI